MSYENEVRPPFGSPRVPPVGPPVGSSGESPTVPSTVPSTDAPSVPSTELFSEPPVESEPPAKRVVTDEHKAAIVAGRVETKAVAAYLEAFESQKPQPGRRLSAEAVAAKLANVDESLETAKPLVRLQLLQDRKTLAAQLEALQQEVDMAQIEADFVEHAASFGQRKGIQYATWREFGVPADILRQAGIGRST